MRIYSPHIYIYKLQTNSTFSLFLRFILIFVFFNFFLYLFSINFFDSYIYNYLLDLVFISEFILIFFVLSTLGEDFIDYDTVNINYWDIDLVTFFNFFFNFSVLLLLLSVLFLIIKFVFWTSVIII